MGKKGLVCFVVTVLFVFGLWGCAGMKYGVDLTKYSAEYLEREKVLEWLEEEKVYEEAMRGNGETMREWVKINYHAAALATVARISHKDKHLEEVLKALEKIRKFAVAKFGEDGIPDETLFEAAEAFAAAGDLEQASQLESQRKPSRVTAVTAEKRWCDRHPQQCDPSLLIEAVRVKAEAGDLEAARREATFGDWRHVDRIYAWLVLYEISQEPKDLFKIRQLVVEIQSYGNWPKDEVVTDSAEETNILIAIAEVTGEDEDFKKAFEAVISDTVGNIVEIADEDCYLLAYNIWLSLTYRGGDLEKARKDTLSIRDSFKDGCLACRYFARLVVVKAFAKAGQFEEARQLAKTW